MDQLLISLLNSEVSPLNLNVITQVESLAAVDIPNHEFPGDPLAYNHKHNPYTNQSVEDIMTFKGNS